MFHQQSTILSKNNPMPSDILVYSKYKRKRMRIFMFILTLGLFAHAQSIMLPDNFQANFTQKITNPKKKVINYSGNVRFSSKTLLKWVYVKPTKKEVCTNGKELTVVDHDLEQVSNYLIDKGFNLIKIVKDAISDYRFVLKSSGFFKITKITMD